MSVIRDVYSNKVHKSIFRLRPVRIPFSLTLPFFSQKNLSMVLRLTIRASRGSKFLFMIKFYCIERKPIIY